MRGFSVAFALVMFAVCINPNRTEAGQPSLMVDWRCVQMSDASASDDAFYITVEPREWELFDVAPKDREGLRYGFEVRDEPIRCEVEGAMVTFTAHGYFMRGDARRCGLAKTMGARLEIGSDTVLLIEAPSYIDVCEGRAFPFTGTIKLDGGDLKVCRFERSRETVRGQSEFKMTCSYQSVWPFLSSAREKETLK